MSAIVERSEQNCVVVLRLWSGKVEKLINYLELFSLSIL